MYQGYRCIEDTANTGERYIQIISPDSHWCYLFWLCVLSAFEKLSLIISEISTSCGKIKSCKSTYRIQLRWFVFLPIKRFLYQRKVQVKRIVAIQIAMFAKTLVSYLDMDIKKLFLDFSN